MNYRHTFLTLNGEECGVSYCGNLSILQSYKLAFICSRRCPGEIITQVYDFAYRLRARNQTLIGGFHTPMEKECLRVFLNSSQQLIFCPARGLARFRLPQDWRKAFEAGRLLILSSFSPEVSRSTSLLAERRNHFVAELADEIYIAHASPGSRTESLLAQLRGEGKKVSTLDPES